MISASDLFAYGALGIGGSFILGLSWNLGKMAAVDIWTTFRTRNRNTNNFTKH